MKNLKTAVFEIENEFYPQNGFHAYKNNCISMRSHLNHQSQCCVVSLIARDMRLGSKEHVIAVRTQTGEKNQKGLEATLKALLLFPPVSLFHTLATILKTWLQRKLKGVGADLLSTSKF
jgi:hypothetical protein